MQETEKQRSDRQLIELLAELRVALPGAQVLLGFLLTVPFATRFGGVTRLQRITLFLCLILTATGTVLLMAPSVYHRFRWEQGDKPGVIRIAHRFFLIGSGFLGAGITVAIFLVGDVLFGEIAASVTAGLVGATVTATWYLLPAGHRRSEH